MFDIKGAIEDSIATKKKVIESCLIDIQSSAELMIRTAKENKSIFWCGNGGSAADSQHMAAELMGGLRSHDRRPIKSIALTTDSSFITAWSNDTSYDEIFSRQLLGIGKDKDILVAISTSGESESVLKAVETANSLGMLTVGFTGKETNSLSNITKYSLHIPSSETGIIQQGHITFGQMLFSKKSTIYNSYIGNN